MSSVTTEKSEAELVEAHPAKQQAQGRQRQRINVRGFVNSPYLLLFVPLLVGGLYLVQHPELVRQGINHPYASLFLLSLPVAVFAIKLVMNFFSVIEQWIRLQFERTRQSKKGYFFEIVTAVFMFVSVCEAGPFFNDIQHNVLNGALGYVTVLAFDLIAVVCIDARRKELAKGGTKSGIYLTGVIICAAVSMVANLYSALTNFQAPADPTFPGLLKTVAPYVGIMFPVMIVFLAFSRDTEIEIDDAETYRKQQQKRVDFLVVRREILEQVTKEMERIDLLRQREFCLKSIFFTRKKISYVIEVIIEKAKETISAEIATLKQELLQKEHLIHEQVQHLQQLSHEVEQLSDRLTGQSEMVASQLATIAQLREEIDRTRHDFSASLDQLIEQRVAATVHEIYEERQSDRTHQIDTEKHEEAQLIPSANPPEKMREQASHQEQEIMANIEALPTNYGLTDEEKQLVIDAFPALETWFIQMPSSVTISEIVDLTSLRQIRITNAITSKKIKTAKGRGNKVQAESFIQWLLQDLQRAAKRPKRSARPIKMEHFLADVSSEKEQGNEPDGASDIPIPPGDEAYEPHTEELSVAHFPEAPLYAGERNGQREKVQGDVLA